MTGYGARWGYGPAELYEIQMPLDTGYVENDVNHVAMAVQASPAGFGNSDQ